VGGARHCHIRWGPGPPRNRGSFWWFFWSIGLNGFSLYISKEKRIRRVKSSQYFHMDNISAESPLNVVFKNVLYYEIEVGIYEKLAKM